MIDVSGLQAINPSIDWQLLNRLSSTSDLVAYVDSLTETERLTQIIAIVETPINKHNLTQGYVAKKQIELNMLLSALTEPLRTDTRNEIFKRQRWAPYINDTGNMDFTGTDKHLG